MSKKKHVLQISIALLTAIVFLMSLSVLTAYADPGDDGGMIDSGDQGGNVDTGDIGGDVDTDDTGGDVDTGDIGGDVDTGDSDSGDVPPAHGEYVDNGDTDSGDSDSGEQSQSGGMSVISDGYNTLRNYYTNRTDDLEESSQSEQNENLGELETVADSDVEEPTTEDLPDVEVSDATLFSGIVMWLCVAVGISVIAGVMVSKRTHRRGA